MTGIIDVGGGEAYFDGIASAKSGFVRICDSPFAHRTVSTRFRNSQTPHSL